MASSTSASSSQPISPRAESLPPRPNLEHLKKLAKRRLKELRQENPRAKLADAQLDLARRHGFTSWRALKARVDALASVPASLAGDHAARLMLQAVSRGDVDTVRRLLAAAPQLVNAAGPHPFWGGRPRPIHVAIERGHAEMFRLLLDAGADVSVADTDYGRWSPLMLGIHWKRDAMRDELLRRGARVGLIEALMLGDDERVKSILRDDTAGLDGPFPNDGTPLHFVRTPGAATMLLDAGADPAAKDKYGQRGIDAMTARGGKLLPIVRRLIRAGVSVEPASLAAAGDLRRLRAMAKTTPAIVQAPAVVHAAAAHGHVAVVRWLLDAGTDVNARATTGSKGTPSHTAAWAGQLEVARLLVERGADVTALDEEHQNTPAGWARTALQLLNHEPSRAVAEFLEPLTEAAKQGTKPAFDATDAARRAVQVMQRAWAESYAMIERRFDAAGSRPRWEATDVASPALLEREADRAILRRGETGLYRMLSVWHVVRIDEQGAARVDASSPPTRVLEFFRDGGVATRPVGGAWRRIDWRPTNTGFTGKPGRFTDIAEALAALQSGAAPPGEYRVVSVRRMLHATREKGRWKIVKKHASSTPALDPVVAAGFASQPASTTPHGAAPKKAKPNWKPIMDAAFRGDAERVRALLKAGADPNVVSSTAHRHRPLHRAIEQKKTQKRGNTHEQVVRALLDGGADPALRGGYVRLTALQLAATGEYRFVPLLLPYFQPLDIFHAAAVADVDRVEGLLRQDRSLANAADANGWRPLHHCCASSAYKLGRAQSDALVRIARLLIEHGADPAATWPFDGNWSLTPMYHCTGQQDHPALAEVLLDAGAVPFDGESVFHAADEDHRASLELFERRCDPKRLAEECTRALRTLMHWGRVRGVPWLLAHGADPNSIHAESGDAPLHSAVKQRNNDRIIRLLLEHGADPRLKNKSGKTAIQLARASSASDRLLPLLSKGK